MRRAMAKRIENIKAYRRTVAIIAVILALGMAFMIIRPFIVSILSALVLAYLFYPLYVKLQRYSPGFLPRESVAAALTCLVIVMIVVIPLVVVSIVLVGEVRDGYNFLQQVMNLPDLSLKSLTRSGSLPYPGVSAIEIPYLDQLGINLMNYKEPLLKVAGTAFEWIQGFIFSIPNLAFNLFITIFSTYFMLKGARGMIKFLNEFFPLPPGRYQQIFMRFDDLSRGMVNGQIVVGIVQGTLAWLGFFVLGVPNPVLWGVLTSIISIIPLLGAAVVWLPITGYLLLVGYLSGTIWKGIAMLIYGAAVISTIDNVLKPKIVGDRTGINPLVIMFGILGGIQLMGIPGILIGPLVLTLVDVVMEIFREVV